MYAWGSFFAGALLISVAVLAAFVDLPSKVAVVGSISLGGALTLVFDALAGTYIAASGTLSMGPVLAVFPYWCFLAWCAASTLFAPPVGMGLQNASVYFELGLVVLATALFTRSDPFLAKRAVSVALSLATVIGLSIAALNLLLRGITFTGVEGLNTWFVHPRAFALVGLPLLAWHLAGWYYRRSGQWILAALWLAAIGVSLSRMATAIGLAIVLVTLIAIARYQPRRSVLALPIVIAVLGGAVSLAFTTDAVRERFFGSDTSIQVGDVAINAMGRLVLWTATIQSASNHWMLGGGLGSASIVAARAVANMQHPHNDYLRVLHDLGIVGLAIFLIAILAWLQRLVRVFISAPSLHDSDSGRFHFAALLAYLAVLAAMLTDNPLVYSNVMGVLGVVIGCSFGLAAPGPPAKPTH